MGDIILVPEPDVQISAGVDERLIHQREYAGGAHGYPPSHPGMGCTLILTGAGIRPHAKLGEVHNCDIAPTAAALLEITMDGVDGRVLKEILR